MIEIMREIVAANIVAICTPDGTLTGTVLLMTIFLTQSGKYVYKSKLYF